MLSVDAGNILEYLHYRQIQVTAVHANIPELVKFNDSFDKEFDWRLEGHIPPKRTDPIVAIQLLAANAYEQPHDEEMVKALSAAAAEGIDPDWLLENHTAYYFFNALDEMVQMQTELRRHETNTTGFAKLQMAIETRLNNYMQIAADFFSRLDPKKRKDFNREMDDMSFTETLGLIHEKASN